MDPWGPVSKAFSEGIHNSHSLVFLLKGGENVSRFLCYKPRRTSGSLPNFRIYLNRSFIVKIGDSYSMVILRDSKLLARSFGAVLAIRVSF